MEKREGFIDKLRVAATCAVVMLHTVTGVMDATDMGMYPFEKKVFLVALDLVCWCVPMFLMISGYLFLNPEREIRMGRMLTKYCRRIVLALLLFGVPYALLEQIAVEKSFRWEMVGKGIGMVLRGESWSHMWYLYLILLLYLLTPALKWILVRVPRWTIYLLLAGLFTGSSLLLYLCKLCSLDWKFLPPDELIYFFYYICGYLFASGKKSGAAKAARGGKRFFTLALLLAAGMAGSRLWGKYQLQMAYNYPFTVLLSLLLFVAGKGFRPGVPAPFWKHASAISFAVYLVHPVFLNIAYKFMHITPLSFPIGLSLPFFFLGTLLLAAGAAWLLCRLPPLRKYVL